MVQGDERGSFLTCRLNSCAGGRRRRNIFPASSWKVTVVWRHRVLLRAVRRVDGARPLHPRSRQRRACRGLSRHRGLLAARAHVEPAGHEPHVGAVDPLRGARRADRGRGSTRSCDPRCRARPPVRGLKFGVITIAFCVINALGYHGVFNLPDKIWIWWIFGSVISNLHRRRRARLGRAQGRARDRLSLAELDARFPGRRALVTGGASGLGLAAAELLAARGWHLAILDRDEARLASAAEALRALGSPHCEAFAVDVTDEAAVKYAVDAFAGRLGGLDVALNSAGVAVGGNRLTRRRPRTGAGSSRSTCSASCTAAGPKRRTWQAAGRGLVVNVASAAAFMSAACMGAYNASKAAVVALSETLHQELAPAGVQVSVAMPGFFRTRLMEHARAPADLRASARRLMDRSRMDAAAVAGEMLARAAAGEAAPRPAGGLPLAVAVQAARAAPVHALARPATLAAGAARRLKQCTCGSS